MDVDEEAVFHEARRLGPGAARASFLAAVCGERLELRARVEALLRVHDEEVGFLASPPVPVEAAVDVEEIGAVIGPYTLLEVLGEGGMGMVYIAERSGPVRRKEALKIIKPGMDTRQVIARFETERQVLAMMSHPNIAKVYNAGATTFGRPYFAMELIEGPPITDYCDRERLSIPERLELFVLVCRAVQHAHQKGIIHRDLKPSNILVGVEDGVASPKVIDFGVAKAISPTFLEQTTRTDFHQVVGTPLYMSPEQVNLPVLDIDTRSDVYSLGVVLYELLTGGTPFDRERFRKCSYEEMRRIIREEEPPKPSVRLSSSGASREVVAANRQADPRQLVQAVRGDLDWIVMRALEKDRRRRYETVNQLAADVTRHLRHQVVEAGPTSSWHRVVKGVRRNRTLVTTTGLVALALVLGLVLSTWQAVRATRAERRMNVLLRSEQEQRREAERHRREAEREHRVSERQLHAFSLRRAHQLIESGQVETAQEILASLSPQAGDADDRGFAWRYLWRLARRELALFREHRSEVSQLALSPDGRVLASGDFDGTILLSSVESGRLLATLSGHSQPIRNLAFSPDGSLLASGAVMERPPDQSDVWVWDVATGRRVAVLPNREGVYAHGLTFTASGRRLAVAWYDWRRTSMRVALFEFQRAPDRLTYLWSVPVAAGPGVAMNSNHVAVMAIQGPLTLLDAETLERRWAHSNRQEEFGWKTFSADGRYLATENLAHTVVWEVATGRELKRWKNDRPPQFGLPLVLSPNGTRLLRLDEAGRMSLFGLDGGTRLAPGDFSLPSGEEYQLASAAAFSPDGSKFAVITLREGGGPGPMSLWDSATGRLLNMYRGRPQPRQRMAFSSDGRSLFVNSGSGVRRWWFEPRESEPLDALEGHADEAWAAAFSPSGEWLATGSDDTDEPRTIKLWDHATGRPRRGWSGGQGTVADLAFAPDGKTLASAHLGVPGLVRLWDSSTGNLLKPLPAHARKVRAVAFHPEGGLIASAGDDRAIRLWSIPEEKVVWTLEGHEGSVRKLVFSRVGGLLASASHDRTARIWDVDMGTIERVFRHPEQLTAVDLSPDGTMLATTDEVGSVRLWEIANNSLVRTLHTENGGLRCVCFSPDGKEVAAAGDEGSIRVWDVLTGQDLLVLRGDASPIHALAFSPDGRSLASCGHSGAARIWRSEDR